MEINGRIKTGNEDGEGMQNVEEKEDTVDHLEYMKLMSEFWGLFLIVPSSLLRCVFLNLKLDNSE